MHGATIKTYQEGQQEDQRHAGGDDIRKDIQKIKVPNWKTLAQDRRRWKE